MEAAHLCSLALHTFILFRFDRSFFLFFSFFIACGFFFVCDVRILQLLWIQFYVLKYAQRSAAHSYQLRERERKTAWMAEEKNLIYFIHSTLSSTEEYKSQKEAAEALPSSSAVAKNIKLRVPSHSNLFI